MAKKPTTNDGSISVKPSDSPSFIFPDSEVPGGITDTYVYDALQINGRRHFESIRESSYASGISASLIAGILQRESRFNPAVISGAVRGTSGEIGIAQFMPKTADQFKVDPYDAHSSILGVGRYLKYLKTKFGTDTLALAAYNWGEGKLAAALRIPGGPKIPSAVVSYVNEVMSFGRTK